MRKIVLASTSPFRRELLSRLRLPFTCESPGTDEAHQPGESPRDMVRRLAREKAEAVAARFTNTLVIGSDQCAEIDGDVLGKPGAHERAVEQLRRASGRCVTFHTGLCLIDTATRQIRLDDVPFEVVFRALDEKRIESYLRAERPYECAGSFKSEGLGIALFDAMRGDDPTALIGLPLIRLCTMLEEAGVAIL